MSAQTNTSPGEFAPLSREKAALVLIDLLPSTLHVIQTIAPALLIRNVVALTQTAQLYSLPILLTAPPQKPDTPAFLPEVTALLPGHPVIVRSTANALDAPEFAAALAAAGRRQIILAGVALDIGVMLPALSALSAGYAVTVPVDATGATDARVEAGAMLRLTQAGASLSSWAAVGMEIQRDLSAPPGRELMALIGASLAPGDGPAPQRREQAATKS